MENLIQSIYETIKDYRADEDNEFVHQSPERIQRWILQFDEGVRIPILTEVDAILKDRYRSRVRIQGFLVLAIESLRVEYSINETTEFLRNSQFLNLQLFGKSQGAMLQILDEILQATYNISLSECGSVSHAYSIYIDDVFCTGVTLVANMENWLSDKFSSTKTNLEAVNEGLTKLAFRYVFLHTKNYHKKRSYFKKYNSSNLTDSLNAMQANKWISNYQEITSDVGIALPIEENQPNSTLDYQKKVDTFVDTYIEGKNYQVPKEFFRQKHIPIVEKLFTSKENRIIVENALLLKGIEILSTVHVRYENIRPLGYSIPSSRNFGFGALCFTWRSVPNNAPLVFCYDAPGFIPLFKVNRGKAGYHHR